MFQLIMFIALAIVLMIIGYRVTDWILGLFGMSDAQVRARKQQQQAIKPAVDAKIGEFQEILDRVRKRHEGEDITDDEIIRECVAETMAVNGLEAPKPYVPPVVEPEPIRIDHQTIDDAWNALFKLGYKKTQVTKAIDTIVANATTNMTSSEIVAAALGIINNLR